MVKQLFPSKTVAQPITPLDKIEEAKKRMEDKKLRELEDAIQQIIGTTEPARPAPKAIKVIEKERLAPQRGKVMFKDKAIIDSIDDLPLSIQNNAAVQGMSNRNIRRAYFLSKDMKITDTTALFSHGDARRELFSKVVDDIVDAAKNSSMQKANDTVESIIHTMKDTDIRNLLKSEKTSWFHNLFHASTEPLDHTNDWYADATQTIQNQLIEVDAIVAALQSRLEQLNKLYETNKDSFELLQVEIAAGKFFIEATEAEIATAENSTDVFAATEAAYHKMSLDQFKNKIVDLEAVAQSVLTNAPQIRLLQLNIQGLGERIKTVKLVYARWKSQFANIISSLSSTINKVDTKPSDVVKVLDQQFSAELAEFAATQNSLL